VHLSEPPPNGARRDVLRPQAGHGDVDADPQRTAEAADAPHDHEDRQLPREEVILGPCAGNSFIFFYRLLVLATRFKCAAIASFGELAEQSSYARHVAVTDVTSSYWAAAPVASSAWEISDKRTVVGDTVGVQAQLSPDAELHLPRAHWSSLHACIVVVCVSARRDHCPYMQVA